MRSGGGKAKGAEFERNMCRQLSLWVSDGKQEDVFWRSAMSGGRSTVAAKSGKRLVAQAGDISCIDKCGQEFAGRYYVECKSYRDLQFYGLLTGKGKLVEFWADTCQKATLYKKHPMLVAKQNQQPVFVGLDNAGIYHLSLNDNNIILRAPCLNLIILSFDSFIKFARLYLPKTGMLQQQQAALGPMWGPGAA